MCRRKVIQNFPLDFEDFIFGTYLLNSQQQGKRSAVKLFNFIHAIMKHLLMKYPYQFDFDCTY